MQDPKLDVATRFLRFIAGYVALEKATLATMGGKGTEAQLWKQMNVDPDKAWLIESGRELSRNLIQSYQFHNCGSLAAFPSLFRGAKGGAGLDGFHMDLCGTIETRFKELRSILPLVKKGKAQCLAITVADSRKNPTLENFDEIEKDLVVMLGQEAYGRFTASLKRGQEHLASRPGASFDPEKGARRELGVFFNIVRALVKFSGPRVVAPDFVERYIYISGYSGQPYRMRTYFFHLGEERLVRSEVAPNLAKLWQESRLFFYDGEFSPVLTPERIMTMSYDHLEALAKAAGGESLVEFLALRKRAENPPAQDILDQIRNLAGGIPTPHTTNGAVPTVAPAKKVGRPPKVASTDEAAGPKLSRMEVKLGLIRAYAEAGGDESKWRKQKQGVCDKFAKLEQLPPRRFKGRTRIYGGILAHTQGKFRSRFIAACLKERGSEILPELVELYSKIEGKPVTVAQLKG